MILRAGRKLFSLNISVSRSTDFARARLSEERTVWRLTAPYQPMTIMLHSQPLAADLMTSGTFSPFNRWGSASAPKSFATAAARDRERLRSAAVVPFDRRTWVRWSCPPGSDARVAARRTRASSVAGFWTATRMRRALLGNVGCARCRGLQRAGDNPWGIAVTVRLV